MRGKTAKKRKFRGLAAAFLSGVILFSLMGCGANDASVQIPELREPAGVDVDTAVVKKMDFSSVESFQRELSEKCM